VTGRFGRFDILVNDAAYNKAIAFADHEEAQARIPSGPRLMRCCGGAAAKLPFGWTSRLEPGIS